MRFEIVSEVTDVETIATGRGIRVLAKLQKRYGRGLWRKRKGFAEVRVERERLHARAATVRDLDDAALIAVDYLQQAGGG